MSVTALDNNTALIVIDLQKGIAALPCAHPIPEVTARACSLARAFRRNGLPVVLVNVAGISQGRTDEPRISAPFPADWTELLPELDLHEQDHLITKQTWGAFTGTNLESFLRSADVSQVVLTGVATSIGVESTARQAFELGFNVTLAIDAMTDLSADAHANSVTRIFPRLGETGTTQQIITLLDRLPI